LILRLFAVDLRTLGAFRIALAALVLFDIGLRVCHLGAHYTDHGVLIRADVLTWFADRHRLPVSVFLAGGSHWFVGSLFAVYAAAAVAMLVGWHARVATALVWLLTTSLHLRNPFVLYGADSLIRVMLLWAVFLPVGARLSLDAFRRPSDMYSGERYLSVASAGLLLQTFIVFFIAGMAKAVNAEWYAGNGILYALDHEAFTGMLGVWLRENGGVFNQWIGWSVIVFEVGGAALLFSPVATVRCRIVGAFLIFGTLVGIAATMRVGLFPAAATVALVPFLPGDWFSKASAGELRAASLARSVVGECAAALILVYTCLWNYGLWYSAEYRPHAVIAWAGDVLSLHQKWGMFTDLPSTGWFAVRGMTSESVEVDLLAAGGTLPEPGFGETAATNYPGFDLRPRYPSHHFDNIHWRSFFEGMGRRSASEGQLRYYSRYLCREWNRRAPDGPYLESLEIIYFNRPVDSEPGVKAESAYQRSVLWIHDCFG
jgi:hypothetical protein